MPIYEYQCNSCGYQFEKLQKISDEPCRICPECESDSVKKLLSNPSFRLKGSGWYETDFKKTKKTATVADTKSGEATSESKPAKTDSTDQ